MNNILLTIPVYTADVSGVASALYELGGLVVIHDPSGCNSTYNTHDEIRWYNKDSLIFISGLTERDAVTGNDEKLFADILETARELKPAFTAITNSPIPYLTGTDFPAIAARLEKELKIPVFYVPANGMHDYTKGAGMAFAKTARRLVSGKYDKPAKHSVNIIGITPLDYAAKGSTEGIRRTLEDAGYKVNSVWAMDDTLENISRSGEASVNLVVSSAGLYAAKVLKERFGTPYVIGTPAGDFSKILLQKLDAAEKTGENSAAYIFEDDFSANTLKSDAADRIQPESGILKAPPPPGNELYLIGESVVMGSLAAAVRLKHKISTKVLCPLETYEGLLRTTDIHVRTEAELAAHLSRAKAVAADPLYKRLAPEDAAFFELPSVALSGRIYLKQMRPLTELKI